MYAVRYLVPSRHINKTIKSINRNKQHLILKSQVLNTQEREESRFSQHYSLGIPIQVQRTSYTYLQLYNTQDTTQKNQDCHFGPSSSRSPLPSLHIPLSDFSRLFPVSRSFTYHEGCIPPSKVTRTAPWWAAAALELRLLFVVELDLPSSWLGLLDP